MNSYPIFKAEPDGDPSYQELSTPPATSGCANDVAALTGLLREAEEHHGEYEPTGLKHHWSSWYAAYIVAHEHGRTPEEAAKDGALHLESAR